MAKANANNANTDDINSILSTIDALASHSGLTAEALAAVTVPAAPAAPNPAENLPPSSYGDVKLLKELGFGEAQITEIKKGVEQELPVEVFAKPCYDWMQMYEIRKGLLDNLNAEIYENPLYSATQMREIRLGLADHLNVSTYAKLILSATDMNRIRKVLFSEAYKKNHKNFGRKILDEETGIVITISNDCMEADMDLSNAKGLSYSASRLTRILKEHGITYGLIKENIATISGKNPPRQEICVAKGKKPEIGKAGWYELFFQNVIDNYHIIAPDDVVDYSAVNTIDSVSPGNLLARYHAAQQDTEGCTVTGILVEGKKGENLPPLSGKGFKHDAAHDVYFASEQGFVTYNSTTYTLNVENVYELYGDINYYKNFEYDGTVYIHGAVGNKVVIRATGNVIIDGFVEGCEICAGQNVVLKGGCNGGERGAYIESGGFVRGKFFENATITAKGLIESNYFLNCILQTDDKVLARSKKARIMGGNIIAALGVLTTVIGNYGNEKMYCTIGDVDTLQNTLAELQNHKRETKAQLTSLLEGKTRLIAILGGEAIDGNPLFDKTCAAIAVKEGEVANLERETERLGTVIKKAKYAYVKVSAMIRENVVFSICGHLRKVENPIRGPIVLSRENIQKILKG